MAFATDIHSVNASATGHLLALLKSATTRVANYRMYRKTVGELSTLSSRELDDLGLNRSMIKRVAMEAAYGL
jgi:uncharacterized protein YjiS (DUF1127 family)